MGLASNWKFVWTIYLECQVGITSLPKNWGGRHISFLQCQTLGSAAPSPPQNRCQYYHVLSDRSLGTCRGVIKVPITKVSRRRSFFLLLLLILHLNLGAKFRNSGLADWNTVKPVCCKDLFFWYSPEFGGKFWPETELLRLTKLRKKFYSLGICWINKKSTLTVCISVCLPTVPFLDTSTSVQSEASQGGGLAPGVTVWGDTSQPVCDVKPQLH